MNPKIKKTTWNNFHTGHIPKTYTSFSVVYKNGVVVCSNKPRAYCIVVKRSHPEAQIIPYENK